MNKLKITSLILISAVSLSGCAIHSNYVNADNNVIKKENAENTKKNRYVAQIKIPDTGISIYEEKIDTDIQGETKTSINLIDGKGLQLSFSFVGDKKLGDKASFNDDITYFRFSDEDWELNDKGNALPNKKFLNVYSYIIPSSDVLNNLINVEASDVAISNNKHNFCKEFDGRYTDKVDNEDFLIFTYSKIGKGYHSMTRYIINKFNYQAYFFEYVESDDIYNEERVRNLVESIKEEDFRKDETFKD